MDEKQYKTGKSVYLLVLFQLVQEREGILPTLNNKESVQNHTFSS